MQIIKSQHIIQKSSQQRKGSSIAGVVASPNALNSDKQMADRGECFIQLSFSDNNQKGMNELECYTFTTLYEIMDLAGVIC